MRAWKLRHVIACAVLVAGGSAFAENEGGWGVRSTETGATVKAERGAVSQERAGAATATTAQSGLSIEQMVGNLRSLAFTTREQATMELLCMPAEKRSEVEKALAAETDVEAATRLHRVALHLFLKGINSFRGNASLLGIALNMETTTLPSEKELPAGTKEESVPAVTVTETQPGFPAAEQLRTGDRIVGMGGGMFSPDITVDDFRRAVNTSRPGTVLRLTVVRSGKVMMVAVPTVGIPDSAVGGGAISIVNYVQERAELASQYMAALKAPALDATRLKAEDPTEIDDEGGARLDIRILRQ